MGSCVGKPKTVDGVKPEAVDQSTDDAKATILNSNNSEITAEDKTGATAAIKNGDNKDEKKESIKQEAEDIKEPAPSPGNDVLKTEAPAEEEEKTVKA